MWRRWLTDALHGRISLARAFWVYGLAASVVYSFIGGAPRRRNSTCVYHLPALRARHRGTAERNFVALSFELVVEVFRKAGSRSCDCRTDRGADNALRAVCQFKLAGCLLSTYFHKYDDV